MMAGDDSSSTDGGEGSSAQSSSQLPHDQKSQPSRVKSYIRFVNKSGRKVDVVWLNYEGLGVRFRTLGPEQFVDVNTFAGHPWIFRDSCSGDKLVVQIQGSADVYNPEGWRREDGWPPRRRVLHITLPVYSLKERCLQVIRRLVPSSRFTDLEIPWTLHTDLLQTASYASVISHNAELHGGQAHQPPLGGQQGQPANGQNNVGHNLIGQQLGQAAIGQQHHYGVIGQHHGHQGQEAIMQQQHHGAFAHQQANDTIGQKSGLGVIGQQQGHGTIGQQVGVGAINDQQGHSSTGQIPRYGVFGQQKEPGVSGQQHGHGAIVQQPNDGAFEQQPHSNMGQTPGLGAFGQLKHGAIEKQPGNVVIGQHLRHNANGKKPGLEAIKQQSAHGIIKQQHRHAVEPQPEHNVTRQVMGASTSGQNQEMCALGKAMQQTEQFQASEQQHRHGDIGQQHLDRAVEAQSGNISHQQEHSIIESQDNIAQSHSDSDQEDEGQKAKQD